MIVQATTLVLALLLASSARADDCPPGVILDGDAILVAQLGAELEGRGIETTSRCATRVARVERRGDLLVISIADAARTVSEIQTAAAVIESFVRDDVGSPLLAVRRLPRPRTASPIVPNPTPRLPGGWHVFAGLEASIAFDHSRWTGMQFGACRMIGVLCAAVRLRGGAVANDGGLWTGTKRKSAELLVGLDIPFRIRSYLLTPGVALGFGELTTESEATSRSSNFRGQAHVTLSVPLTKSLALDISTACTLTQQVEREPGYMTTIDEPLGYVRFGLGVRYGSR